MDITENRDTTEEYRKRARALVKQMTLEERLRRHCTMLQP